jgi:V8-like Glu-specific endopeptidase
LLRWLSGRGSVFAFTGVIAMTAAVAPATGAATGIVSRVKHAVDRLTGTSTTAQPFTGAAAVGALFTMDNGKLGSHFCTASVVHSPAGDLALTAAHCVTGLSGTTVFVPRYNNGQTPYGIWRVTHVYTDSAWQSSQNPDDDFAFVSLSDPDEAVPIEDITGAEQLGASSESRAYIQVIGYPDGAAEPVECANWTKVFSPTQLEFDCGGYSNGTSGAPFLSDVSSATDQGVVVGVIGGYEQGGLTSSVSYSVTFGSNVESLYKTAISG